MLDINYIRNITRKYFPRERVKKRKILVIDDNPDTLGIIQVILSKHDFRVEISGTSKTLNDLKPANYPDLFIIDVHLKDGNGKDLCIYLKNNEATKHIPVILYTANSLTTTEMDDFETGADCLLSKPFTIGTLTDNIINLLNQSENINS